MYRIADMTFEGSLRFEPDRIYANLPAAVAEEHLSELKAADKIDILAADGETIRASYGLIGWASIENSGEFLAMSWFRYSSGTIDSMQEQLSDNAVELDDILGAICELGELVSQLIPQEET